MSSTKSSDKKKELKFHSPGHWDSLFDKEFKGESDRACVILAAALLDAALETLLRTFLLPPSTSEDSMLDGVNAPLGTFSARIDAAYRFGLIDTAFARSLHLVRRIRNDFAHNITGCSFQDSSVLGRMTELNRITKVSQRAADIRAIYPDGPRGDFQLTVGYLQWLLRSYADDLTALPRDRALDGEMPIEKVQRKKRSATPAKGGT